jgi:hypothetical protein
MQMSIVQVSEQQKEGQQENGGRANRKREKNQE